MDAVTLDSRPTADADVTGVKRKAEDISQSVVDSGDSDRVGPEAVKRRKASEADAEDSSQAQDTGKAVTPKEDALKDTDVSMGNVTDSAGRADAERGGVDDTPTAKSEDVTVAATATDASDDLVENIKPRDVDELIPFEEIKEPAYLVRPPKHDLPTKCDCTEGFCGEDCINRQMFEECGKKCPFGNKCLNKRIQKKQSKRVERFLTEKKGFGLRALEPIAKGDFIAEYCGEVYDLTEFEHRKEEYRILGYPHFYFMSLDAQLVIDATRKGGISRFINHSCEPNAKTQKWSVLGTTRIGFFAIKDIAEGEEITFDYKYERYGEAAQPCYCGSKNCRGVLGVKRKSPTASTSTDEMGAAQPAKARRRSSGRKWQDVYFGQHMAEFKATLDDLVDHATASLVDRSLVPKFVGTIRVDATPDTYDHLLDVVQNTTDSSCLACLVHCQFLSELRRWLSHCLEKNNIRITRKIVETIKHLPITARNHVDKAHLLPVLERVTSSPDLIVVDEAKALIDKFSHLKKHFEIPKASSRTLRQIPVESRHQHLFTTRALDKLRREHACNVDPTFKEEDKEAGASSPTKRRKDTKREKEKDQPPKRQFVLSVSGPPNNVEGAVAAIQSMFEQADAEPQPGVGTPGQSNGAEDRKSEVRPTDGEDPMRHRTPSRWVSIRQRDTPGTPWSQQAPSPYSRIPSTPQSATVGSDGGFGPAQSQQSGPGWAHGSVGMGGMPVHQPAPQLNAPSNGPFPQRFDQQPTFPQKRQQQQQPDAVAFVDPSHPAPLHPDYASAEDPNGKTYFYHLMTRKTTWDKPILPQHNNAGGIAAITAAATARPAKENAAAGVTKTSKERDAIKAPKQTENTTNDSSLDPEILEQRKKLKVAIRKVVDRVLSKHRQPGVKYGHIRSDDDMQHLSRKLTRVCLEKELRRNLGDYSAIKPSKRMMEKVKEHVIDYLKRCGKTYVRSSTGPLD